MSKGTAAIVEYLARSRDVFAAAIGDQHLIETTLAVVERVCAALGAGCKVLLAGNGGSAAAPRGHLRVTGHSPIVRAGPAIALSLRRLIAEYGSSAPVLSRSGSGTGARGRESKF